LTPNELILMYGRQLLRQAPFHTGEVHAMDTSEIPQYATRELLNVSMQFEVPRPDVAGTDGFEPTWPHLISPNLEWAEEHFLERVSGVPMNPAPSHVRWPYAQKSNAQHTDEAGTFSHTYPERFWPRYNTNAVTMYPPLFWETHSVMSTSDGTQILDKHGDVVWEGTDDAYIEKLVELGGKHPERRGIRYRYGDLQDVLNLMDRSPLTRQAFLPVWFPEDTGAVDRQRVPCTLGYHFIIRDRRLYVTYFMRSCDYVRYLRDDIYMAGRLAQWMVTQLTDRWDSGGIREGFPEDQVFPLVPGTLTLHITSLHAFVGDDYTIRRMVGS
jgi:hypothetical protein